MNNLLEVRDVHKTYSEGKKSAVYAVKGVSFQLNAGEILGLIGESGCGKSTLAKLLLQLERPGKGEMLLDGIAMEKRLAEGRLAFYRDIQMVFQNPFEVFDSRRRIAEILSRPLLLHHLVKSKEEARQRVLNVLGEAGLRPAEDFARRYPHELSGGQLQRIAILRAMLLEPRILVADEPVTMLDVSVRADILNLLLDLQAERGTAILFISHDLATTAYISDRLMVMKDGLIVEEGPTEQLLNNPKDPYTEALLAHRGGIKTVISH